MRNKRSQKMPVIIQKDLVRCYLLEATITASENLEFKKESTLDFSDNKKRGTMKIWGTKGDEYYAIMKDWLLKNPKFFTIKSEYHAREYQKIENDRTIKPNKKVIEFSIH